MSDNDHKTIKRVKMERYESVHCISIIPAITPTFPMCSKVIGRD